MRKVLFIFTVGAFVLASCGGGKKNDNNNNDSDSTKVDSSANSDGKIDPFKDFPKDAINASAGDVILTPSKNWQEDATEQGPDKVTFIFYNQTLAEVGNEYSKVDFMSDKGVEIPNYMIIPIKPSQTAKKGDIILTWWQSGSGMKRAIVVDDSDPAAPGVNYIDIKWDNPATNDDGVGIGQMTEKIEPGTFHVISSDWESGTTVAAKEDGKYVAATVVKLSGDKVLTIGFAGKMKVYAKSDCTPIPIKPTVKVGDMAQAPWTGSFKNMKVEKIDAKLGRVWLDDPYSDDPLVAAYGDVTTGLDIPE